jgi:hypothetical protein
MKRMKVVMSTMLTNPKDPERNKKRYEFMETHVIPYVEKKPRKLTGNDLAGQTTRVLCLLGGSLIL